MTRLSDLTTPAMPEQTQEDLLSRGYSRRSLGRVFGLLAAAPSLTSMIGGQAQAQTKSVNPHDMTAMAAPAMPTVRIGANECWTGPLAPGAEAAAGAVVTGNRYTGSQRDDLIKAVSTVEGVPTEYVMPWPGSSDPLARIIVTYCSPTRGLVTADPTFELAESVATYLKVPVKRVPLSKSYAHDVKAMLAADPNAGVYYVCTPNNPTATITPIADVEWLLANKPEGSIVLLDEAYTHFAGVPTGSLLAAQDEDIIVLRTFSKLFGMAGMRLGVTMARPDLMKATMRYDGLMASYALPNPSVVCGTASLLAADLITQRREDMIKVRATTLALLDKREISYIPPEANFFMVDWKKPAKGIQKAFSDQGVEIGRSWPIWPTVSRVTVGSAEDMEAFNRALVTLNL